LTAPALLATSSLSLHDALPISDHHHYGYSPIHRSRRASVNRRRRSRLGGGAVLLGRAQRVAVVGNHAGAVPVDDEGLNPREEDRSEEHTSELQSRSDIVCRLLL